MLDKPDQTPTSHELKDMSNFEPKAERVHIDKVPEAFEKDTLT